MWKPWCLIFRGGSTWKPTHWQYPRLLCQTLGRISASPRMPLDLSTPVLSSRLSVSPADPVMFGSRQTFTTNNFFWLGTTLLHFHYRYEQNLIEILEMSMEKNAQFRNYPVFLLNNIYLNKHKPTPVISHLKTWRRMRTSIVLSWFC